MEVLFRARRFHHIEEMYSSSIDCYEVRQCMYQEKEIVVVRI